MIFDQSKLYFFPKKKQFTHNFIFNFFSKYIHYNLKINISNFKNINFNLLNTESTLYSYLLLLTLIRNSMPTLNQISSINQDKNNYRGFYLRKMIQIDMIVLIRLLHKKNGSSVFCYKFVNKKSYLNCLVFLTQSFKEVSPQCMCFLC